MRYRAKKCRANDVNPIYLSVDDEMADFVFGDEPMFAELLLSNDDSLFVVISFLLNDDVLFTQRGYVNLRILKEIAKHIQSGLKAFG